MRYDSSLTLSENKEMLMEQNTFYYDNLGNLKGGGPITVPTGARMASKLFPNLNQSQYPKKILPTTAEPKPTTPSPTKWDSQYQIKRGPANQIKVTKWKESYPIKRGVANTLF